MKKLTGFFILVSIISCSTVAHSQDVEEVRPGFVLLDVLLYRPVGLAATIIGTGLYIGISPLTALASIPEPHDAFVKTGKILILLPANYTFVRPLGDRSFPYRPPQDKHRPVERQSDAETYNETYNMAVKPGQRPVPPKAPGVPLLRHP
ncbi:hypothetical protein [Methylobacter sp.]|uniref:hypothetical protein n=1 Tax=Methylobacter sp. TaxID=2051955 RepID=UPI0011FE1C23|nr:hypothetical protein [Methylobacter sp.]TAK61049.1 MAG: hypothetical protein EPO18_15095 [Methylobacter sp.]